MTDILDEFLEVHRGTVIVNLWEEYTEACREMERVMAQLEALERRQISVLRLNLSQNRKWARNYSVRGTPTLLVFRDGHFVTVIRGLVDLDTLLKHLEEFGV